MNQDKSQPRGNGSHPPKNPGKKLLFLIPGVQPGETWEQFGKRVMDTLHKKGVFQIIQRRN